MKTTNDGNEGDPLQGFPPLLTLEETAALFRVTTRTLRRWIRIGKIRSLRTAHDGSGRVLVEKTEVCRLIDSMRMDGKQDA